MLKERFELAQARLEELREKMIDMGETVQIAAMVKKDEIDDKIDTAKGNLAVAQENVRMSSQRMNGKVNAELIRMQMSIDAAREHLYEKKEESDKKHRRDHIEDLIEYSEMCEAMATRLLAESDLALLQAASEANAYAEEYGEDADDFEEDAE